MFQIYIVLQIKPLLFRGSIFRIKLIAMMPKPDPKHLNLFICTQYVFSCFLSFCYDGYLITNQFSDRCP